MRDTKVDQPRRIILGEARIGFDPLDLDAYAALFADPVTAVWLEAPGSLTFEMTDVPLLARLAGEHGAVTMLDNTWATPLYFKALDFGVEARTMRELLGAGRSVVGAGGLGSAQGGFVALRP